MSIKEVIEQLESLVNHCNIMQEYTSHRPWCDDVKALNIAIDILKRYDIEGIINAKDFKNRINNMQYVYLQDCAQDVIDAIDCEVTYFKEKQNHA